MRSTNAKVILVGAGPGDPDLITLKGVKALQKADAVLYDALANDELLDYVPENAVRINVGKRVGNHRYSQEQINQLLVDSALTYGTVVRLKGGDPFVFGRGSEEVDFVSSFGIDTEVIPGISSSIAVPASQGISVTKRGVSESFWVITATTSSRKLSKDIELAAQSSATVVILMGMNKLDQIVSLFQDQQKGELPVAIIQNGTLPDSNTALGTIDSIVEIASLKKVQSPAVIVIGEVVGEQIGLKRIFEENFSTTFSVRAR